MGAKLVRDLARCQCLLPGLNKIKLGKSRRSKTQVVHKLYEISSAQLFHRDVIVVYCSPIRLFLSTPVPHRVLQLLPLWAYPYNCLPVAGGTWSVAGKRDSHRRRARPAKL